MSLPGPLSKFWSALLCAGALAGCSGETFQVPDGDGEWVLVDLVHTRLQNPEDYRLDRGEYGYQGVHGYARIFDHLQRNGYPWTSTRTMILSEPLLEGFSVLFINLLHEESPDFLPEEIDAVQAWVQAGGGLFVIADHTNVYRHAERLNPLLEPMGVRVGFHTALDGPAFSVSGSAWINISTLTDHPTNAGIDAISFQTGGLFETEHGSAFLSADGMGDFWDESDEEGFYGNWVFDGDESVEPRGEGIAVVAAAEYGAGRVFVVGDQNIYGDVWVHFGDNFAHAANGFEWLAGVDNPLEPLRDQPVPGLDLAVEYRRSGYALGQSAGDRYYGLFHHLNRHQGVTARATGRLDEMRDALILPTPFEDYSDDDIEAVQAYLQAGRKVVVMVDVARLTPSAAKLLLTLAPDVSFEIAGTPADLSGTSIQVANRLGGDAIPRLPDRAPLEVYAEACGAFDPAALSSLSIAGREAVPGEEEPPFRRLDITSSWGAPLFDLGGRTLARRQAVDAGELIVVFQDRVFRNWTLGPSEASPPPAGGDDVAELIYGLEDYLAVPRECAD